MPDQFRMRLQKLMDEYAGGVTAQFTTSGPLLEQGLELLKLLKEDCDQPRRLGSARPHALLGEHAPHVPGRGARPFGSVP